MDTTNTNATNGITLCHVVDATNEHRSSQSSSTCLPADTATTNITSTNIKTIDSSPINDQTLSEGEKNDGGESVEKEQTKALVPNFRVEGTGGDSSITTSLVTASAIVCGNGVEHGSGSDHVSSSLEFQSSEEMKLSLVSWYSEPDDASKMMRQVESASSSCCDGLIEERQTISMTGCLMVETTTTTTTTSEEKENIPANGNLLENGELGNSRESVLTLQGEDSKTCTSNNKQKMHVQLFDHGSGASVPQKQRQSIKPECSKCNRRSKSGRSSPTSTGFHSLLRSSSRTPANRRVIPSTKSSAELKKPIKSILKGGSKSGSGSDNKSSMDSLGSTEVRINSSTPMRPSQLRCTRHGTNVTKSADCGGYRAKFNMDHQILSDASTPTSRDDKTASKLRRIEKYATLRLRKTTRMKPLDILGGGSSESELATTATSGEGSKATTPGDLMTKSMSFLEKSSRDPSSLPYNLGSNGAVNNHASSVLKRTGSVRVKNSAWEPCTTRTTALRMQKMQEAKAKSGSGGGIGRSGSGFHSAGSGSVHTGSTHSGSGESIPHITNNNNHQHSASAPPSHKKEILSKPLKVFAKLSSALGQTASSNQKRLKQERGVQTEELQLRYTKLANSDTQFNSLSPIPSVDTTADLLEQIKQLERLANRYKTTALRFQSEYEKSEERKIELANQLKENQSESNEMIEFLQAEKSTLAESLAEIETEAKTWRDQIQNVKKETDARCSTLVRLSEQHKQEAMTSQTLLQRLESQSNALITSLSAQISEGTSSIQMTKERVNGLTESLIKAYKVPQELLVSFIDADSTRDPTSSLLVPLISSLAKSFPVSHSQIQSISQNQASSPEKNVSSVEKEASDKSTEAKSSSKESVGTKPQASSSSLQNLNQAIINREAAESIGLDQITLPNTDTLFGLSVKDDMEDQMKHEISELNSAIGKLLLVVRVIVIQCDKRVSTIASSILQCLNSMEDDKMEKIPEIAKVQKSLEAWHDTENRASQNGSKITNNMIPATTNGHH